METRSLQRVGGGTYTVSIPKAWAEERGLEAGSDVYLYTHADGSIVVRTTRRDQDALATARVAIEGDDPVVAKRALAAAHAAGFDAVRLVGPLTDAQRRAATSLADDLVGAEAVVERPEEVRIRSLLDAEEVSISQSLVRLQFVALSAHRRATAAVREADGAAVEPLRERAIEAERLAGLIERHFGRALASRAAVDRLGLSRARLFDCCDAARLLERVARAAERIAAGADRLPRAPDDERADAVRTVAEDARDAVDGAVTALLDGNGDVDATDALAASDRAADAAAALRAETRAEGGDVARATERVADELERTADHAADLADVAVRSAVRERELQP